MSYNIKTDDSKIFRKDLKNLRKHNKQAEIFNLIRQLAKNPFAAELNIKKLSPKIAQRFRLRVGDYRVVYSIDFGNKIILVHRIALRGEIYE